MSLDVDRPHRERRVLLLLFSTWMLSAFDLVLTLAARALGVLDELNPVASWLIYHHGDQAVVVYKVVLMSIGTVILWACRRRKMAESASWLMLIVYVALSFRWYVYYHAEVPDMIHKGEPPISVESPASAEAMRVVLPARFQTRTVDARSEAADAETR